MQVFTVTVEGLTANQQKTVRQVLMSIEGVESVDMSSSETSLRVVADCAVHPDELVNAVAACGFAACIAERRELKRNGPVY